MNNTKDVLYLNEHTSKKEKLYELIREYLDNGLKVIPLRSEEKIPAISNWTGVTISKEGIKDYFPTGRENVGVVLGEVSGNLIDIDLDSTEAIALAPYFLPITGMISGRSSRPKSHWFYKVRTNLKSQKFIDHKNEILLEIRSDRQQTMIPPSVHPLKEEVIFYENTNPKEINTDDLVKAVRELVLCSFIARHWPEKGIRNDFCLALSGTLLGGGISHEKVKKVIYYAAHYADDEEAEARVRSVCATEEKLASAEHVTGISKLKTLMGEKMVNKIIEIINQNKPAEAANQNRPQFRVTDDGVERRSKDGYQLICSELRVLARTRSSNYSGYGKLLRIKTPDGKFNDWILPMHLLGVTVQNIVGNY